MRVGRQPSQEGWVERLSLLDVPKEPRAGKDVIDRFLRGYSLLLVKEAKDPLDLADQHVLFVPELGIERGAADIGTVDDLLHRDPVVPLLLHQRQQGVNNEAAAAARAPIGLLLPSQFTVSGTIAPNCFIGATWGTLIVDPAPTHFYANGEQFVR